MTPQHLWIHCLHLSMVSTTLMTSSSTWQIQMSHLHSHSLWLWFPIRSPFLLPLHSKILHLWQLWNTILTVSRTLLTQSRTFLWTSPQRTRGLLEGSFGLMHQRRIVVPGRRGVVQWYGLGWHSSDNLVLPFLKNKVFLNLVFILRALSLYLHFTSVGWSNWGYDCLTVYRGFVWVSSVGHLA